MTLPLLWLFLQVPVEASGSQTVQGSVILRGHHAKHHDEVRGGRGLVAEASLVVLPVFLARGDLFVDSIEGSPNAAHRAGDADVLFAHNLESLVYQL